MSSACIFCRIVAGELPSSRVHENDVVIAILDINPINPGHTLVIPRRHTVSVTELTFEERGLLLDVGARVAAAFGGAGIRHEGFNMFLADGEAAGQDVFHTHLHVIPRFVGDGFKLSLPPDYGKQPPREELDAVAESIRARFILSPIRNRKSSPY